MTSLTPILAVKSVEPYQSTQENMREAIAARILTLKEMSISSLRPETVLKTATQASNEQASSHEQVELDSLLDITNRSGSAFIKVSTLTNSNLSGESWVEADGKKFPVKTLTPLTAGTELLLKIVADEHDLQASLSASLKDLTSKNTSAQLANQTGLSLPEKSKALNINQPPFDNEGTEKSAVSSTNVYLSSEKQIFNDKTTPLIYTRATLKQGVPSTIDKPSSSDVEILKNLPEAPSSAKVTSILNTAAQALNNATNSLNDSEVNVSNLAKLISLAENINQVENIPNLKKAVIPSITIENHLQTQEAASKIRTTVEQSGLFYESHLQAWSQGLKTLEAISNEPQAKQKVNSALLSEVPEEVMASIPNSLKSLLASQMTLLNDPQLNFSGTWMNVPFNVEFLPEQEQNKKNPFKNNTSGRTWNAKLKIETPHLGPVEVFINLTPLNIETSLDSNSTTLEQADGIIRITVKNSETAAELLHNKPVLMEKFSRSGLGYPSIEINFPLEEKN